MPDNQSAAQLACGCGGKGRQGNERNSGSCPPSGAELLSRRSLRRRAAACRGEAGSISKRGPCVCDLKRLHLNACRLWQLIILGLS